MDQVPFEPEEIRKQCRHHLAKKRSGFNDNFLVLQDDFGKPSLYAIKIAVGFEKIGLEYDLAMMQYLKPNTKWKRYTVPTGYGIVHDGKYDYLVMERLLGSTMGEIMGDGKQELSEDIANDIAAAVRDLRESHQLSDNPFDSNFLTPLGYWYPQSPIFGFDNDGGRLLTDREDFVAFMTARFNAAGVDQNVVTLDQQYVITHGELSQHNVMRCLDGTIGFIDLRTTFLAPAWWEFYALRCVAYQGRNYTDSLKDAMIKYGIGASPEIIAELDNKFIPWFARLGPGTARKEKEEIERARETIGVAQQS